MRSGDSPRAARRGRRFSPWLAARAIVVAAMIGGSAVALAQPASAMPIECDFEETVTSEDLWADVADYRYYARAWANLAADEYDRNGGVWTSKVQEYYEKGLYYSRLADQTQSRAVKSRQVVCYD